MKIQRIWLLFLTGCLACAPVLGAGKPVLLALDAAFGHATNTSEEAIKRGMQIAIDEVNKAGGVLGGRPLALVSRDNRSVPLRGVENVRELAANPDVIAVFTGKFSPVVQELVPVVHELKLPLLAPWSAADDIVDNGRQPNFVFRLSLRDTWAIEAMMGEAHKRKLGRIGMLMPNTGWGRSSLKAAEAYAKAHPQTKLVDALWYNWGDKSLIAKYRELLQKGAQTIVLVANEGEGSILVKEIAQLPANERLPILSHWGITGGQFVKLAGEALTKVDLSAVQTYSFIDDKSPVAQRVLAALKDKYGVADARKVEAPVGVAHAYDLVHLLAQAINQAGRADREAVRTALENLKEHKGLVRHYRPPFTASRHEALALDNVFLARYEADGALVRAGKR